MRRKGRYIRNGSLLLAAVGLTRNLYSQSQQLKQTGQSLNWDTVNFGSALKSTLEWGAGGALAGLACYNVKVWQESMVHFLPDIYLRDVLAREHLKSDPASFNRFLKVRAQIKDDLNRVFDDLLACPVRDAGSFAKRTAIYSNHDLDLLLVFKSDSFYSLRDMYYYVQEKLNKLYDNTASVEERGSAFTITMRRGPDEFSIDIVPGRLIAGSVSELNFYKRSDYLWSRSGYQRANINKQRKLTMYKPEERQIIKLLKIYRDLNGFNISGVAIEQMVISAMSERQFGVSWSIKENLLNVMDYMSRKILADRLSELSNADNNLLDGVSWWEKQRMSMLLISDISRVDANPRYLREIFNQ